ncbi:unnamed protein product [Ectocarpus sp. 8 AP-2014]
MKRAERDSTAAAKASFIDLCIELGAADSKTLIKNMLHKKYKKAGSTSPVAGTSTGDLPTDVQELLRMDPAPSQFVDYVYLVCSMENELCREDIIKTTLTDAFDAVLTTTQPRKSKRQKTRKLPSKLSPFVLNEGTSDEQTLQYMDTIVEDFFPDMAFVIPCVYADEQRNSFVLFIPERQVNKWKAAGSQCKFTWRIPEQDKNKDIFARVISAVPRVHVVRERSSEVVYMGTCKTTDDVSSLGTCTMFVS